MNTKEFLDLVLPDEGEGFRVIGALATGSSIFKHAVFQNNEAAAAHIKAYATSINVYHALASYKQGRYLGADGKYHLRTQENVLALKSFWMDLDVKPGIEGHYQSREDAVASLKGFCTKYSIPRPFLVASGRYGVHVYWTMDAAVPAAVWKPRALVLKSLSMAYGMLADHAVTADTARVLRPAGAYNLKLGRDPVDLLTAPRVYAQADLLAAIDLAGSTYMAVAPAVVSAIPGTPPVAAGAMENNTAPKFDSLPASIDKVASQCHLIGLSYETGGAKDSEPMWYACMGIAGYTDDVEYTVEKLAGQHPDYDLQKSMKRIVQWKAKTTGPTTCRKLQEAHGDSCKACPHNGKITTPLQLGRYVPEAEQPVINSPELGLENFVIPNPPKPFKRGQDKGIYYEVEDASGATTPIQVCPFDLYPVRIQECERKEERNIVWRADLPHSGVRDILIPARAHLAESNKLLGELAAKGVTVQPKNAKIMQEFMVGYIRQLQDATPAAVQFARMGWREDGTFVTPYGLCTPNTGQVDFPAIQPFAREIKGLIPESGKGKEQKGTLEGWAKTMSFYNDPRYVAHQMGFLLSAASPLLKFTNVKGLYVNLVGLSGSGKTTVGYASNSMWGHPVQFGINGNPKNGATLNSIFRSISLRNHIGLVIDEVSNWKGEQAGEFAYNISQGTGRMRMNGAESFAQFEDWCQIAESSSNQAIAGKIGAYKSDSNAELMRLIEFRCEPANVHTKAQADSMLRHMSQNYGLAGPAVMQFIVEHRAAIEKKIHDLTEAIDKDADIQSGERFWSAGMSCAIVMLSILRKLELVTWDAQGIYSFALQIITDSRRSNKTNNAAQGGVFNTLLNAHIRDTLVVMGNNTPGTLGSMMETPLQLPHGKLLIRREHMTNTIYVAVSLVKKYCDDHGVDQKILVDELMSCGALQEADKHGRKVLGANTNVGGGQVRCWKIDSSKLI